ncbi:prohibitin family protein [Tenuifilum thalassicum]|uniref:Prohibitin family protein n=1 Tax=Tenuifilum thalassicum TaxID=2590900 RepID=A0A7D4CS41_9BACT|nr:prohibitin family protein [Tenuifilum thalassicum]QKG80545.1 prohibitin family protein [Tenuifilum thalassicum]
MVLLKIISWIILIYGIIALIIRKINLSRLKLPLAVASSIAGAILVVLLSLIVVVGPQEVAVVTTPSGVRPEPLHTGWHIIAPWNNIHYMDKTVWVYTCANAQGEGEKPNSDAIWAPTKDGIKLGFDVSVSWRIDANQAPWIYQNVTENDGGRSGRYIWLEENVIRAKLKSALALTVSGFTPIEAYSTKRNDIQQEILQRLKSECQQYRIIIDNVDVREVYYNEEYEKAINAKKLAEQEALRLIEVTKQKEEQLKQATIDKNIAIEKAKGESEALKIKGQSISSNPKIIELEWINKWNGQLPTYMMGNGQGIMVNLNNK